MTTQYIYSAELSQSLAPHPSSSSSSSLPSSTHTHIPPRLPPSLITTILTFILPYSGALPPDLLSKPFQQRLIFLPPGEDEMDKQLSPFPLPVGVNALMERLEALAREHALGKERYGWDGEAYVAKRELVPEHELSHVPVAGDGQGLELHFMHEAERGWTFHGLRIPEHDQSSSSGIGSDSDTPSSGLGMVWSDDPSDVSVPLSHTSQSPHMDADNETAHVHAAIASAASGSSSGLFGSFGAEHTGHVADDNDEDEDEPENAYQAELKRQKEASAFWSAWSPDSKNVELPTPGGSGMSDQQREEDYWAQYSAGPSVAPSAAQSPALPQRRLSERSEMSGLGGGSRKASYAAGAAGSLHSRPTVQSPQQGGGRVFDAAGGAGSGYPFPSVSAVASTHHNAGYSDSTDSASQPQLQASDVGPSISLNSAPPSPPVDTPGPAPARLSAGHHPTNHGTVPASASSSDDANLLRTRLTSKMTSLLRRAWNAYIAGVDRQDELEVRAMRWLTIGRAVCLGPGTPTAANMSFGAGVGVGTGMGNGWHAQSSAGGDGEKDDDVKARMETMYELFDVSYNHDLDDDQTENDGHDRNDTRESRAGRAFYKLIEEAVRPANGTANAPGQQEDGQHGYGPMGAEGLERTYSTEQLSFWES